MKVPEPKHGSELRIIGKHVILSFATLALAILALHVFRLKITFPVILANAFMIYLATINLCGYDLYRHDKDQDHGGDKN